jgi:hypothetical protein
LLLWGVAAILGWAAASGFTGFIAIPLSRKLRSAARASLRILDVRRPSRQAKIFVDWALGLLPKFSRLRQRFEGRAQAWRAFCEKRE